MAIKVERAKENQQKLRAAIALALISAPNPFPWSERTVSIDVIVEEVRKFLGVQASRTKRIYNAVKKAVADWLPAGWIDLNDKKCLILKKEAEKAVEAVATSYAFA